MNYTKLAIEKAISGGLKHPETVNYLDAEMAMTYLDPTFWSSLGKALGWPEKPIGELTTWIWYWHRFIDHLADNHTPEEFFEKLLAK